MTKTASKQCGEAIKMSVRNRKKFLSLLLAVCLLAGCFPLSARADGAYMAYEAVRPAYHETFQYDTYEYSYTIPEFNPSYVGFNQNFPNIEENVEKVNQKIYHDLYDGESGIQGALSDMEKGYSVILQKVDYDEYTGNDNVLSIVTTKQIMWGGQCFYNTYNISLSSGEELSVDSFIKICGWEKEQYESAVKQALAACFQKHNSGVANNPSFKEEFDRKLQETLSSKNFASVKPYLNQKGELCIAGRVLSLAGAGGYEYLLNLKEYTNTKVCYEPVLQKLIDEQKYGDEHRKTWNRGLFYDIDGDSREELLILREVTGKDSIDCLTGMVFTSTVDGKIVPLIGEETLQYNVAAPRTAIRVLKKNGKNYISVFSRNSVSEGVCRRENGSHRIYEVYGGSKSTTSVYDTPAIVKYEMVENYQSGKTEVDVQESSASIDGKKVSYQEYLSYMQGFEEKEYVSAPFMEGITDPVPRGYSFEELLEQCKASSSLRFSDVPASAYYYDAVAWAVENGITVGTDKTHFSPEQRCTRAQIVTFLWRDSGSPEPNSSLTIFSDVKAGEYYEKAVKWAVEQGVTNGTGKGKFSPEASCTRAQAVTFLWRAAGEPEPSKTVKSFSDVKKGSYYEKAVKWAVEQGITAGTGNGKFSPESGCTRAQIVSFLYRAYQ